MVTILAIAAVVLIAVIVFQISKTGELLSVLKGLGQGEVSDDTNRFASLFWIAFLVLGMIGIGWSILAFKSRFLPEAASVHGVEIDSLFNLTLFFTGVVFIITHILLFYFAYRYRGTKNGKAYYYPHNNKLELVWTVIPAIVLTVLVIFGIKAWFATTGPAPDDALIVEATAQQFNWTIRYPGKDHKLGKREFEAIAADNPLGIVWSDEACHDDFIATEIHLPVNKPVLFKLGAKDVLHSFFLPHFRVKMDCVPGIPTQFWLTPTITTAQMREKLGDENFNFILACAELCGQGHWNMRMNVIISTEEEYKQWVAEHQSVYESRQANLKKANEEGEDNISGKMERQQDENLTAAL